jgi:hypothetical protein
VAASHFADRRFEPERAAFIQRFMPDRATLILNALCEVNWIGQVQQKLTRRQTFGSINGYFCGRDQLGVAAHKTVVSGRN